MEKHDDEFSQLEKRSLNKKEKILITPENYDEILKEKDILTFQAVKKPVHVSMFEAKEDIHVQVEEKGLDNANLVYDVSKGDIVARAQDGRVWSFSKEYLEENYIRLDRPRPKIAYTFNEHGQVLYFEYSAMSDFLPFKEFKEILEKEEKIVTVMNPKKFFTEIFF